MENIGLVFAAAFAAALAVMYTYGKATSSVWGYMEYKQAERQRQYHVKQLQVFIDAANEIDDVIGRMMSAIPVNKRRESLKYADFDTIDSILRSVNSVAAKATKLCEVFNDDFALAQQSRITNDSPPEGLVMESLARVNGAVRQDLSRGQYWDLLHAKGIFTASQLFLRDPAQVEREIISQLST